MGRYKVVDGQRGRHHAKTSPLLILLHISTLDSITALFCVSTATVRIPAALQSAEKHYNITYVEFKGFKGKFSSREFAP